MKVVILIMFFMCMMVTVPYLFLDGMPFDSVIAYENDCGEIIIEHGANHGIVSASIYYSLFITVAFGIPFIKPEINKMMKIMFYALGFWVFTALVFTIYNFTFNENALGDGLLKTYFRFLIAFILLIVTVTIENSWIKKLQ